MTDDLLPQRVVVYHDLKKDKEQVYTSVYTDEEAKQAVLNCAKIHGARSQPRTRDA
jgi:hypothetical protein